MRAVTPAEKSVSPILLSGRILIGKRRKLC